MPVYNGERYLAEAVESILAQTYRDFEFIVIDDGSKDGSRSILESFAARDPRMKVVSRPNTGIIGALNEGLGLARGELVARMDADDIALPERLAKQVAYMDDHPDCVMAGSRVQVIDPDGSPLTILSDALTHDQIVDGFLAARGQLVHHPAVIYRKDVVLRIGAYRDIFDESEDLDLFLRLAEVGRIVNMEEPLLKYREHLAKASRAKVVRVEENTRRILEDAHRRRGLEYRPPAGLGEIKPFRKSEVYRTWAWWALDSGNVPGARKHAWACLARTPFDRGSWVLLLCAIRGR